MLGIIMQFEISTMLTLKVTTIIYHHMKILFFLKQKIQTYGRTRPKLAC